MMQIKKYWNRLWKENTETEDDQDMSCTIGTSGDMTLTGGSGITYMKSAISSYGLEEGNYVYYNKNEYGVGIRGTFRVLGIGESLRRFITMNPGWYSSNGMGVAFPNTMYDMDIAGRKVFGKRTMVSLARMLQDWKMIRFCKKPLEIMSDTKFLDLIFESSETGRGEVVLFNKPVNLHFITGMFGLKSETLVEGTFNPLAYWTVGYCLNLPSVLYLITMKKSTGQIEIVRYVKNLVAGENDYNWLGVLGWITQIGEKVVGGKDALFEPDN